MPKPAEIIFFDLDETLIVNEAEIAQLMGEVYRAAATGNDNADKQRFFASLSENANRHWQELFHATGNRLETWFGDALSAAGLGHELAERAALHFLALAAERTRLADDAIQTLKAIRQRNIATGIITNGFVRLQSKKIDTHALANWADVIVVSEQAGAHKPDRLVFDYALNQAGCAADRAWHIGDHRINDVAGAKRAGMTAVFYQPNGEPFKADELDNNEHPDHQISELQEVLALLDQHTDPHFD